MSTLVLHVGFKRSGAWWWHRVFRNSFGWGLDGAVQSNVFNSLLAESGSTAVGLHKAGVEEWEQGAYWDTHLKHHVQPEALYFENQLQPENWDYFLDYVQARDYTFEFAHWIHTIADVYVQQLKDDCDSRGITLKVMFSMRCPVSLHIAWLRNRSLGTKNILTYQEQYDWFWRSADEWPDQWGLHMDQYHVSLEKWINVMGESNVKVIPFAQQFTQQTVDDVKTWIGWTGTLNEVDFTPVHPSAPGYKFEYEEDTWEGPSTEDMFERIKSHIHYARFLDVVRRYIDILFPTTSKHLVEGWYPDMDGSSRLPPEPAEDPGTRVSISDQKTITL